MRLFVAVALPLTEQRRVLHATRALRAAALPIRWLEPDAFHVTLQFLGEVADVQPITAALGDVAARHAPFELRLHGAGAFPDADRPSVLWIGVEPSGPLRALRQDVERVLAPLGYPGEARPFAPHLTIGRVRRDERADGVAPLLADVQYDAQFTIATLDLMQSFLSPRGARYERILAAELAA